MSRRRRSRRGWIICTRSSTWPSGLSGWSRRLREAVKLAPPEMQEVIRGLQALRGIAEISAVTIVAELGKISRFESARQLMGYSGAVPSEDSSGKRKQRGPITKTGNAHLRRIAVEAAWSYRLRPAIGPGLRKRQEGVPEEIKEIAWKAQLRLAQALRQAGGGRQGPTQDRHRRGTRTAGLHLGHRIKAEAAANQQIAA